jgi:hypothetical protein
MLTNITSTVRNLGQFHRSNWKDAANINNSSIRAQQSTVAITGSNMAALRNHNLATTECYAFILEPFVNLKPCDYLPTFDVTREGSVKFSGWYLYILLNRRVIVTHPT